MRERRLVAGSLTNGLGERIAVVRVVGWVVWIISDSIPAFDVLPYFQLGFDAE
jgi:hypothetical protein